MSERMAVITLGSKNSGSPAVLQWSGFALLALSVIFLGGAVVSDPSFLLLSFVCFFGGCGLVIVGGIKARSLFCSACGGAIPHQSVAICKHCRSTFRDSRVH